MWWLLYFIFSLIVTIISLFPGNLESLFLLYWINTVISIIGLVGLFSYVFKKPILSETFWKTFFWVFMASLASLIFFLPPFANPSRTLSFPQYVLYSSFRYGALIFTIFIISPMGYALYRLGHPKKSKKEKIVKKKKR